MARKRFEFWLNDQRQEDWLVYELIGKLKKPARGQGQFTRAIREGIRLWTSLRDGQIDVLLELFPWVKEALTKSIPQALTAPTSGTANSDLAKEIAAQIILQGGTNGYLMQSVQPVVATTSKPLGSSGGIKSLTSKQFDLPIFEDDDDLPTIAINTSVSSDASMNFVNAMKGLG